MKRHGNDRKGKADNKVFIDRKGTEKFFADALKSKAAKDAFDEEMVMFELFEIRLMTH